MKIFAQFAKRFNSFAGGSQVLIIAAFCAAGLSNRAWGQAEPEAFGTLRGIRVDGELMAFTTGVRAMPVGGAGGFGGGAQAERLTTPQYTLDGNNHIARGGLNAGGGGGRRGGGGGGRGNATPPALSAVINYQDVSSGTVNADIQITANAATNLQGIYFYIHLPGSDYSGGSAQLSRATTTAPSDAVLAPNHTGAYLTGTATGVSFTSPHRQLVVTLPAAAEIIVQPAAAGGRGRRGGNGGGGGGIDVYFPISTGNLAQGDVVHANVTLKASGDMDKTPAMVVVDPSKPGSPFNGIGANFRIQSPKDPPEVDYNLANMRVAYGRVNLAWNAWQPNENDDPVALAKAFPAGPANTNNLLTQLEMAQKLAKRGIPFVASAWFPPAWATTTGGGGGRGGGNATKQVLNQDKWDEICKSITSYIQYMKDNYGAEPDLFSFNESDGGYNILQTAEEHAFTIKSLGAYFQSHGLKTKMLLGDTGNPPQIRFIQPALNDPEALKYVGAVSYHSWGNGTDAILTQWGDTAKKLGVPLLVAEAGTDSASYAYPGIFIEPWYGIDELMLYVRCARLSQPLSIMQWQFTNDYSLLTGPTGGPYKPTQRFFNLKQLSMTPAGSKALPITCDKSEIAQCAYVDTDHNVYTIHLVNSQGPREVDISGLPTSVKAMNVWVTDFTRSNKELEKIAVNNGNAKLTVDTQSLTTLISAP